MDFLVLNKLASKKKSPYESPTKKAKPNPVNVNTNILNVERITKGDSFMKELKEIFEDKKFNNYKIN